MANQSMFKALITNQTKKVLITLLAVGLVSCNSDTETSFLNVPYLNGPLVTADPLATVSPTPFIPLLPTETPLPTATVTPTPTPSPTPIQSWGDFLAPEEPSATEIPRPLPRIEFPDETVNIILLGSDLRPRGRSFRSDAIMILSLDTGEDKVSIISIPRDLYVYVPGWRVNRINSVDLHGGPEMVKDTILYNFGIEIDYWVRVNFSGFVTAVDLLGGIDVQVNKYLHDKCGDTYYTYNPGVHHMDGWKALCYVRMRYRSSDFDRLRREQEVIRAFFNRLVTIHGITKVPQLYDQFNSLIETDITVDDIVSLIPLGIKVASDTSRILSYKIDSTMVTSWRVPYSGASVLLPNRDAIEAMLQSAFEH
jgi:LCP family protein required for cell wall assembly